LGQLLHPKRSIRMPLVRLQFALVFSPSGGQIQALSFFSERPSGREDGPIR
jgi:hypothetical protein